MEQPMNRLPDLPSYAELFEKLDFKKGDEAWSVYSPAAYLADLLQLQDDSFVAPGPPQNGMDKQPATHNAEHILADRRSDIPDIALNAENTLL
jgi:hypothetical protein